MGFASTWTSCHQQHGTIAESAQTRQTSQNECRSNHETQNGVHHVNQRPDCEVQVCQESPVTKYGALALRYKHSFLLIAWQVHTYGAQVFVDISHVYSSIYVYYV